MIPNERTFPPVEPIRIEDIKLPSRSARLHSPQKLRKLRVSMTEFGFVNPIIVDEDWRIIAGAARFLAARELGYQLIPAVVMRGLSDAQKRALSLLDNKLVLDAKWDMDALAEDFRSIIAANHDPTVTGFETAEIDAILLPEPLETESDEDLDPPEEPVSRLGDRWICGDHVIVCGDATLEATYLAALNGQIVDMCFTDPPYNVAIKGNVSGRGKVKHDNFLMGSGEQSKSQFVEFLTAAMALVGRHSKNGAIHFVCMDWRSIRQLFAAGETTLGPMLNLVVWAKTNGGMGSFYRSQHELIAVFKSGDAPHVNNIQLGRLGRYRTNVWTYPGTSSNTKTRKRELAEHPTVKPTAMIADAICDASNRGDLVLDPFGGSGSTLIAANAVGRRAVLIELDSRYVDVALRRYERATGKKPHLEGAGSIDEVRAARREASSEQ